MEKILAKEMLINWYNGKAFTHNYIFGYVQSGIIYAALVKNGSNLLPFIAKLDKASSKCGGGFSIKWKPNKADIQLVNSHACQISPICTIDFLESNRGKLNRGQFFENLCADFLKMAQVGGNAKFTESGDLIDANGNHWQVKFAKATFTNETTMHNLR